MIPILLSKIAQGIKNIENDCWIDNVNSDSRTVTPGSIFLAIKGERVNGQDYAARAVEKGARLVVTEDHIDAIPDSLQAVVPSVLDASIALGANVRKEFDLDAIGVTGSLGKTTTKDFIYAALSPFARTVRSVGNQNNELGMPKTIYGFTHEDRYAILEMGMEAFGDVHKLSMAAYPVAALITGIGISHLERMGTRENILKAKMEIIDGMPEDGLLVLNGDDDLLPTVKPEKKLRIVYFGIENDNCDVTAVNIRQNGFRMDFTIRDRKYGDIPCSIPAIGIHNVRNAISAYLLVTRLGFDAVKTAGNLSGYVPSGMRQHFVEKNGILFIEDCYNAAPDSMRSAIDAMMSVAKGRTIAVLGDMFELGPDSDELHRQVGRYAREKGVDMLISQGENARLIVEGYGEGAVHFDDRQKMTEFIASTVREGDTVVFKASHSMRYEDIIEGVYRIIDNK